MGEEGRRLQRLLSRRRRTGVARQELRISTPDAERPERLARKAKPVRTEPVVNLDQDESFRQMTSNNSVHHLLDIPDEVWCVIEFRCHFHLY